MTCAEQLTALGFDRLGADDERRDVILWLRTGSPADMLVEQTREDTHAKDAARLIYEAGLRDKREELAGRWKDFTDALRSRDVSDLWRRAREMQAEQTAERIAAHSMPKT